MLLRCRISNLSPRDSQQICSLCFQKGYASQPSASPLCAGSNLVRNRQRAECRPQRCCAPLRPLSTTRVCRAVEAASATRPTGAENPTIDESSLLSNDPTSVRDNLRKWSRLHQKSIQENAPNRVQLQRNATLPASLFIRSDVGEAQQKEDDGMDIDKISDSDTPPGITEDSNDSSVVHRRTIQPGDAFRIEVRNSRLRPQLAVCVCVRDTQYMYFLADGRWYADCQGLFTSYAIPNFATLEELSRIEAHLPQKAIEYQKAEGGGTVPFSAFGEVPYSDAQPILSRFAALTGDIEDAKRKYSNFVDQLYDEGADESEFKFETFADALRKYCDLDFNALSDGAKLFMIDAIFDDERLIPLIAKTIYEVGFVPKRMLRSSRQVMHWTRTYQDAAARAATGKNVMEELQANPLTGFIRKARRLVSKSREIRLPTEDGELGLTIEKMRPPDGRIERIPGEEFTADEKMIIEFLWLTFVRRPGSKFGGGSPSLAIGSVILRAVGAYPHFSLDANAGLLFLKELGCLDPWLFHCDSNIIMPLSALNLHQRNRMLKEKSEAAASALKANPDHPELRLSDSMAHLRKDWGDLEVFCIDSASTRTVDDGISIEPSQEFPDHHWIHVHISHVSAFVPHDSPLLARASLMGSGYYHIHGVEPYIPQMLLDKFSLEADCPVLTVSTLLSSDGSVKDIQITAGTVHNVVKIDKSLFEQRYSAGEPSCNSFSVGSWKPPKSEAYSSDDRQKQLDLLDRHKTTFDLLEKLLLSRWDARYRETSEHLLIHKLPNVQTNLRLDPIHDIPATPYERIFRSEHVLGDPTVTVYSEVVDYDRVRYQDQIIKFRPVSGAMMLACESAAVWANMHKVPVVYRSTICGTDFPLSKLNSLGPNDSYVPPLSGESIEISKHLSLSMPGYMHFTSPLRRYRDLINHHQIDAYLKAQANQPEESPESAMAIQYPRSAVVLRRVIEEESEGNTITKFSTFQRLSWMMYALYRAFQFQEAKLPEVWDVFVDNPVNVKGDSLDMARVTEGKLGALGLPVVFAKTKEGWEDKAKFRQWLPARILKVEPRNAQIFCEAVGPPSDSPHVDKLQYPELQRQ